MCGFKTATWLDVCRAIWMQGLDERILPKYIRKQSYQKEKLWQGTAFSQLSWKRRDAAERVKHRASFVSWHVFTQLRFKSNKADCAVANRASDFWESKKKKKNCTFSANPARGLKKSHCVTHRLNLNAAKMWTANFTCESPRLTLSWASPLSRTHCPY